MPSDKKAPYDPERADRAIDSHVADFVDVVRRRLWSESERIGRPAHVVAAFDTELFGHWWYEGPAWLERVLSLIHISKEFGQSWIPVVDTAVAAGTLEDPQPTAGGDAIRVAARAMVVLQADSE